MYAVTAICVDLNWRREVEMGFGVLTGILAAGLVSAIAITPAARAQMDRYDALANAAMVENRPTAETTKLLKDELLFQRATQTYLWALPLINTLGMKVGSEKAFGVGYNILPVWKKRLDAKTLVTTPNSDVIYAMSYLDVGRDGPLVFEAAPGLQGILLDFWQRPILGPTPRRHGHAGRCRILWSGQRQGRQVPDPASGLRQARARRLFRVPIGDQQRLRVPALVLSGPQQP
jgi:hypothetical protein